MPELRVALLVPGFSSDESDWCIPALLDFVRVLSQRVELEVFTLRYPHRRDTYRIGNATVQSLGWGQRRGAHSLTLWLAAYDTLVRRHRESPFDCLHAFWADEPAWIGAACAAVLRLPLVVSVAGGELSAVREAQYGLRRHPVQRQMIAHTLRSAAIVTGGSRYLLELARAQGLPQLAFAPLGVDTQMFSPAAAPPGVVRLLTVGSLQAVKGHAVLLRAMRRVADAIPDAQLTIAGDGPERPALERMIASLQLAQHVSLAGDVPHERLAAMYRTADLYVQSSWHEAQGMVVLEAAACGLPLAGTAVGTLAEFAPDAAVAVPVGDERALANAISALLTNDQRRRALAQAALARARAEFTVDRGVARFTELYGPVSRRPGKGF